jgi:cytosine/adenosine deaminase-related metal-dependent hydrolase
MWSGIETISPLLLHFASPGFFNTHRHAAMTLEQGRSEGLPFDRWRNEKILVAESPLDEDVTWGAAPGRGGL